MKDEKFCFKKSTGLIALVGILLVGFVLFAQMTNQQTSTSSKASGVSCNSLGGKVSTQTCDNYLAVMYPTTSPSYGRYTVEDLTGNVTTTGFTGYCCKIKAAVAAFDCTTVAGTLKEKLLNKSNNMWACTYYTGKTRNQSLYTGTAAGDCSVSVKNNVQCAGYDANFADGVNVSPFTTPGTQSQQNWCQQIANQVYKLFTYKDSTGTERTTGCSYFKPTGTPRNPNIQNKDNCLVNTTNDSSRCTAVGTAITAAGACNTKRCWNGELADNDVCYQGGKCVCNNAASTTELPHMTTCE